MQANAGRRRTRSSGDRAQLTPAQRGLSSRRSCAGQKQRTDSLALPNGAQPVTLGPGEPFTATFTVAFYFSLLLSMPIILYQLYAFLIPAFSPEERRGRDAADVDDPGPLHRGRPLRLLPRAAGGRPVPAELQLRPVQHPVAGPDYYKFAVLSLAASGIVFQVPVAILALTRLGVVTPQFLMRNWRYAIVILTVIAVLLPGHRPGLDDDRVHPAVPAVRAQHLLSRWFFCRDEADEAQEPREDLLD